MQRAQFTVETKEGTSYDANHLVIEKEIRDGKCVSILSFLCSGSRLYLKPDMVKEIRFSPTGAFWCSECDARIDNVI